jgi:hypothetical protein
VPLSAVQTQYDFPGSSSFHQVTGRYLVEALLEQQKQNGQPTDVSLTGLPLVAVLPAVRLPSQSAAAMQPLNSVNASLTAGPSIVDVAPRAIVSGEQLGMIPIVLLCVLVATLIIIGLGCASWTGIKRALALDKEPSSKEPQLPTHLQNRAPPVSSSVGWFELVTFSWVANMLARARDAARAGTQFKFSQLEPLWKTESFELAYEQTVTAVAVATVAVARAAEMAVAATAVATEAVARAAARVVVAKVGVRVVPARLLRQHEGV